MCVHLSGYAKRAGRGLEIIQFPNLDRHEEIWERKVEIAARAGEQWAIAMLQRGRQYKSIQIGGLEVRTYIEEELERMVSWEYPLHLGAFREAVDTQWYNNPAYEIDRLASLVNPLVLESGLKQSRLPDWWDSDYADELFAHIDHIAGSAAALYEWMQKNEVKPTEEHWRCLVNAMSCRELAKQSKDMSMHFDSSPSDTGGYAIYASQGRFHAQEHLSVSLLVGPPDPDPRAVFGAAVWEQVEAKLRCTIERAIEQALTVEPVDWYELWEDPANRIPAWRTEEKEIVNA